MTKLLKRLTAGVLTQAIVFSSLVQAATPTVLTYDPTNAVPPNVRATPALPLIMLNMSKDHQLFYRAYNEFSDYNNDSQPDGTYLHTVRYSGYFDTTKCYAYDNSAGRFKPSAAAGTNNLCASAWHGNFLNWATMTRMDILRKVLYGGYRSTDTSSLTVLERASLPMDAHSFAKYYANAATPTADRPNISGITPFSVTELTLCNTTFGGNTALSHTNTNAPLLRATSGNYALWNAHERRQCRWAEETVWDSDGEPNGNNPSTTGLSAQSSYPSRNSTALSGGSSGDFTVRVEVCNASLVGSERCRGYPSGNLKPIGLLQEYGENDQVEFGLVTGSFSKNTSGGVLRKNASSFKDEVNLTTDGSFRTTTNGIVSTLNRIKVYGYRYSDGTYIPDTNCTFQLTGLTDNQCTSWGNPIGEMFITTLRYLAGLPASSTYGTADAKGGDMSLTVVDPVDPFTRGSTVDTVFGKPQCRPINVVNFNASVTSYDNDTTAPFSNLNASGSLASYTDAVGVGEGIAGTARFVGRTATQTDGLCTAKTVSNLSAVDGICPLAPAYRGSYSLAGAAYWANTNAIRSVPSGMATLDAQRAYRVRTYSVALAPGVPRITVKTGSSTPSTAVIQPAYRLQLGANSFGSGTLVDFRVIEQTDTSGKYLVVWEDSEQGGDYDQDVNGLLSWQLNGTTLTVKTQVIAQSTVNAQGFGYTISGTNKDGVHFHSGILGFNYTDPTNISVTPTTNVNSSGGCSNCNAGQAATTATYTVNGNVGSALEDPLWYAAKWGGFRNSDGIASGTPGAGTQWDAMNNLTGSPTPDGIPDNYFEVFNPDQLEQSLRLVFQGAATSTNAAPAISSSQLISTGFKYVASFNQKRMNGDVSAFGLRSDGSFSTTAAWSVGGQLTEATSRQVITNNQNTGIAFNWSTISASTNSAYLSLLRNGTSTISAEQAQRVVQFVRGDRSVEGTNGIRSRDVENIMGPVVNASPWLQARPSARFFESTNPGYGTFVTNNRSRPEVLWVASNDAMLHAFNASTGAPIMSYVPEAMAPRLNEQVTATSDVRAFVDGSPFTADVDTNAGVSSSPNWRTYLFGSLGRGGRGIFALDTTTVATLSAAESTGNPASIFKWQFTANDDADLGRTLSDISVEPGTGQPAPVVKLQDGRFAVVFGNGYGSSDGKAALFILPVQGPNNGGNWTGRYYKIVLDAGPNNGLSTPTLLDTNNDGRADTVYAGDLRGNLWKIDISSTTPSNWGSAYTSNSSPTPLYVATASNGTTRLPITGAPQFSFPSFGGVVVSFATGLSVLSTDFPNTTVSQRVYSLWDRPAFAAGTRALPRGTSTLAARVLTRNQSGQVVISSGGTVDFQNANAASAQDGWYFQLPGSSEMVLSNIDFRAKSIFFTSVRPDPSSTSCSGSPLASFYLMDPITGFAALAVQGTVDANGVQQNVLARDVADQKVRVVSQAPSVGVNPGGGSGGGGGGSSFTCPDGSAPFRIVGQSTDVVLCFQQNNARFQWREIPGLRTN
jgi:type IV pilus assembly protein PilY1